MTSHTEIEMITIPLDDYEELVEAQEWVAALDAAGVDNWDGIEYAHEIFRGGN